MQLIVKNKQGNTVPIDVDELVSVDGKPFCGTNADFEPWRASVNTTLEEHRNLLNSIVAGMFTPQEQTT